VPEDSSQFAELLGLMDQARNPALHAMAEKMRGGKPWNPFTDPMHEDPPMFCGSVAELVARVTEYAITNQPEVITIRTASGRTQKFELLHEPNPPKKGRKH
jgi:hypothetical protein